MSIMIIIVWAGVFLVKKNIKIEQDISILFAAALARRKNQCLKEMVREKIKIFGEFSS